MKPPRRRRRSVAWVVTHHLVITLAMFLLVVTILEFVFLDFSVRPASWLLWWILSFAAAMAALWLGLRCSLHFIQKRAIVQAPERCARISSTIVIVLSAILLLKTILVNTFGDRTLHARDVLMFVAWFTTICAMFWVYTHRGMSG